MGTLVDKILGPGTHYVTLPACHANRRMRPNDVLQLPCRYRAAKENRRGLGQSRELKLCGCLLASFELNFLAVSQIARLGLQTVRQLAAPNAEPVNSASNDRP